jgi:hypothetical protein
VCEVQRQRRREFATELQTRLKITRNSETFEANSTVHDVHKRRSRKHCTATNNASSAIMLKHLTRSPQKSANQCSRETEISILSVQRILERDKWEFYISSLSYAMNEDDPDQRIQFCE